MFYVSDIRHTIKEILYGIKDTDDNSVEYFTKSQVLEMLKTIGFTTIKGATYTGSDIKFELTSPTIIAIDNLEKGSYFTLVWDNEELRCKKDGVLGTGNGWLVVKEDGRYLKLTKKVILHKNIKLKEE